MLGGFALLGESYGFAPQRLMGDLYGVATAFFFGAYVLAVRAARARHGAAELMFVSTAITAVCLFVDRVCVRAAHPAAFREWHQRRWSRSR